MKNSIRQSDCRCHHYPTDQNSRNNAVCGVVTPRRQVASADLEGRTDLINTTSFSNINCARVLRVRRISCDFEQIRAIFHHLESSRFEFCSLGFSVPPVFGSESGVFGLGQRSWTRTPCAKPRMCVAGKAGAKVRVRLEFLEGRLHLPILKIERI